MLELLRKTESKFNSLFYESAAQGNWAAAVFRPRLGWILTFVVLALLNWSDRIWPIALLFAFGQIAYNVGSLVGRDVPDEHCCFRCGRKVTEGLAGHKLCVYCTPKP